MSSDFSEQQKEFLLFLKLLQDNDLLNHVLVIGSWAEYIYAQTGLLKNFNGSLKTLDVDFLIKNLRLPRSPANIRALAAQNKYEVLTDPMYETTKFISPNGLEIEFLINQMGSGVEKVLKTNLGVNAQALRHLQIALNNSTALDFMGLKVNVPIPEAYVIGKMVINHKRTPLKQEKDVEAIYRLAPYLNQEVYCKVYNGLFKKEQAEVNKFIVKHGPLFEKPFEIDDVINDAVERSKNCSEQKKKDKDLLL